MRYHLIHIRWLLSKNQNITSIGKDVEKNELLNSSSVNVNWCNYYGKYYGGSSKI